MKILICMENSEYYIARCYEAFKQGMKNMLGATLYGDGYDGFDDSAETFQDIFDVVGFEPDVLFVRYDQNKLDQYIDLHRKMGLAKVNCLKVIWVGDWWTIPEKKFRFWAEDNGIGLIVSFFPQAAQIYSNLCKTQFLPPCFDSRTFKDWGLKKEWNIGFLGAGIDSYSPHYRNRRIMHNKLLASGLNYFWKPHPGWSNLKDHPLVGENFSKAINKCSLFVNTCGATEHPNAKYIEIPASGSVMLANRPQGIKRLHLEDGVNFVEVSIDNLVEKAKMLLNDQEKIDRIRRRAVEDSLKYHTGDVRAKELRDVIRGMEIS